MNEHADIQAWDWYRIFHPEHIPWAFLGEIVFRTTIMFLVLIIGLKFLSKRGVKQLSVFELAILIALGSATGDPMFYDQIPLTHGILVLIVVIMLYRLITRLTFSSKLMEILLEGKSICLVQNGKIEFEQYKKTRLPYDKFFAELRLKSVDHLGQVRKVYLETSGEISIYMFEDEEVVPGLPIYPESLEQASSQISQAKDHVCIYCGNVQYLPAGHHTCSTCRHDKWLLPESKKRVR